MFQARARAIVLTATAAGVLAVTGSALAAHPHKGGKYSGFTSERAINGVKPPVKFTVSKSGTELLGFKWAALHSFPSGAGFGAGDPWHGALVYPVGTIPVTGTGSFSIKSAKSTYKYPTGASLTTISTVIGKFTSASTATGTIKYSQNFSTDTETCSAHITFKATVG
jgi:hypothetical protein